MNIIEIKVTLEYIVLLWLPPRMQEVSKPDGRVIECVLLSGLFIAAFQEAAGRDGDLRTGSISSARALRLKNDVWFSRSRSIRSFCPFRSSTSYTSLTDARLCDDAHTSCSHSQRRVSIVFLLCHHCPDRPRHFVRKRDSHQHEGFSV